MVKSRELLETASRLAEFGDPATIRKVSNIVLQIKRKNPDEYKDKFVKMIALYRENTDILGGGKTLKQKFPVFVDDWLKMKKVNGNIIWKNDDLEKLSIDEFIYVLGWAGRVAKERSPRINEGQATLRKDDRRKEKYISNNKDKVYFKKDEDSYEKPLSGNDWEKQKERLMGKYGKH